MKVILDEKIREMSDFQHILFDEINRRQRS
jgi:hypothetical protein